MRRLAQRRGETVAETLAAVLMITLIFLFLAGAVVTAARINAQVEGWDPSFSREDRTRVSGTVRMDGVPLPADKINLYRTDNGYYYYEYQE